MTAQLINTLILRELRALRREIEAYPDDESLWREAPGIVNPGGTLAMHCAGNLQHFVGAVLGGDGYVRDRDAEFASRGFPRAEVVEELDRAAVAVERVLTTMSEDAMTRPFPEQRRGRTFRTDALLTHLASHLAYHLGQVDYHRRLVTGDNRTVSTMSLDELPTGIAALKP